MTSGLQSHKKKKRSLTHLHEPGSQHSEPSNKCSTQKNDDSLKINSDNFDDKRGTPPSGFEGGLSGKKDRVKKSQVMTSDPYPNCHVYEAVSEREPPRPTGSPSRTSGNVINQSQTVNLSDAYIHMEYIVFK